MTGTGTPGRPKPGRLGVRISPPALSGEWCNPVARSALARSVQVRILIPQLTPPRTAAAPPSYGGWPGSAPGGGSMSSLPYLVGSAASRSLTARVRLPPRTPSTGVSTETPLVREAETTAIACAGALPSHTAVTLPLYGRRPGSAPGRRLHSGRAPSAVGEPALTRLIAGSTPAPGAWFVPS